MNKYIKLISFVLLFIIILSTSSCFGDYYRGPYVFWRQDRSNIEKIKICSYDKSSGTRSVIAELPKEATDEIIDEISTLQFYEIPPEHPHDYSSIIVCVTYLDGEIELISFRNSGYISPDGKKQISGYAMDYNSWILFYNMLSRYADENFLIEVKQQYITEESNN